MLKVKVDGVEIEVPQGATVLQACELAAKDSGGGGVKLALALALLMVAAPAHALQSGNDEEFPPKQVRAIMHAYAKCVVGRQPRKASEALLANLDNATLLQKYDSLIIGDCLVEQTHAESQMSFSGDLYRYALADALVRHELAAQPVPDFSNVPPLDQRAPGTEPQPVDAKGRKLSRSRYADALKHYHQAVADAFAAKYGECVVRSAPAESKALLLTAPDSSEETARFDALRPALGTCMAEGHTITFGRVSLRGSIAINYYRLAHAARPGAPGTAG
jgi:hypothetical protein